MTSTILRKVMMAKYRYTILTYCWVNPSFEISLFLQMEGVAILITCVYMWCTHLFIYISTQHVKTNLQMYVDAHANVQALCVFTTNNILTVIFVPAASINCFSITACSHKTLSPFQLKMDAWLHNFIVLKRIPFDPTIPAPKTIATLIITNIRIILQRCKFNIHTCTQTHARTHT